MKFQFIKEVDQPVRAYNGEMVKTGDVIDLNDWLSSKAMKNPNYKQFVADPKKKTKKTTKKVNGRLNES